MPKLHHNSKKLAKEMPNNFDITTMPDDIDFRVTQYATDGQEQLIRRVGLRPNKIVASQLADRKVKVLVSWNDLQVDVKESNDVMHNFGYLVHRITLTEDPRLVNISWTDSWIDYQTAKEYYPQLENLYYMMLEEKCKRRKRIECNELNNKYVLVWEAIIDCSIMLFIDKVSNNDEPVLIPTAYLADGCVYTGVMKDLDRMSGNIKTLLLRLRLTEYNELYQACLEYSYNLIRQFLSQIHSSLDKEHIRKTKTPKSFLKRVRSKYSEFLLDAMNLNKYLQWLLVETQYPLI